MDHYNLFINGEFVDGQNGEKLECIDPGTGLPFATTALAGTRDVDNAVMAARQAFDKGDWSRISPRERAEKIYLFADEIAKQSIRIAMVESMDAGHVIRLSTLWGMLCQGILRNYGHFAAHEFPWEEEIPFSGNIFASGRDYIRREPIGVCVGIVPWNFPVLQTVWKIAHAIVMGNTIVVKPSSITPLSASIIGEAAKAAGLPKGVVNILPGKGNDVGEALCTHPEVDKISLTGSTEVGRMIMKMAADNITKVSLELGGKSANIILDDADMGLAAAGAAFGTFWHQGQVCESGTRILVHSKKHDEFIEKLKQTADHLKIGYQLAAETQLGPMANATQLATVERYVELGKAEGADLYSGGHRVEVPGLEGGYYYSPTIFTNVDNSMRIAQEEIFGPVVCVIKYDDEDEAVAIANDSKYGLAGGIFTTSNARAQRIAREIKTGTMWVNTYHAFGDYAPFGGYKQSGIGREMGENGLKEYTEIKRVHISSYTDEKQNFLFWRFTSDEPKVVNILPFNCQTNVISGKGTLAALTKEVSRLGCSRALILTDVGVRDAGIVKMVQDALGEYYVATYDKIGQDSDLDTVDEAVELARNVKADCIVSAGGGSVIDTGKAVCITLKNGGCADDHITVMRLTEKQTPHIVVPTTSGTGSEVTNAAMIKNKRSGRKVAIMDNFIVPDAAILDPRCTLSLPAGLTAQTGMDAMTHAIESATSVMPHNFSDGNALHAIRLIKKYLPRAIKDGNDIEARASLQQAATMAGWAINMTQTALVHAMAHTLGALYEVPHGAACGIILPKVMRFNVDFATDKLAMVAEALGVRDPGMSDKDAAMAAADDMEKFLETIGHPQKLSEFGVPDDGVDIAAFHAVLDVVTLFNPRPVTDPSQVADLYREAL